LPLRLVLDTNIWLDWLVFDDAGVAPIKSAVASAQAEIFVDAACAAELVAVLAYPLRKKVLAADAQAACMMECRRVAHMMEPVPLNQAVTPPPDEALPKCRDADDQKFLELARACRADFLVTKDRLLLELARRKIRRAPFRIVTPAQLNAALIDHSKFHPRPHPDL
jgi:putative PIN family toxin of toxin-antitoxin system